MKREVDECGPVIKVLTSGPFLLLVIVQGHVFASTENNVLDPSYSLYYYFLFLMYKFRLLRLLNPLLSHFI